MSKNMVICCVLVEKITSQYFARLSPDLTWLTFFTEDDIRPFRALFGLNLELDSYVDATERSPDLGPAQKDVMSDFRECLVSSLKIMMQRSW